MSDFDLSVSESSSDEVLARLSSGLTEHSRPFTHGSGFRGPAALAAPSQQDLGLDRGQWRRVGSRMSSSLSTIIKRNGEVVSFDRDKIAVAVYKAGASVGHHDRELADTVTQKVVDAARANYSDDLPPTVENLQDFVERALNKSAHPKAAQIAKSYNTYRHERAQMGGGVGICFSAVRGLGL